MTELDTGLDVAFTANVLPVPQWRPLAGTPRPCTNCVDIWRIRLHGGEQRDQSHAARGAILQRYLTVDAGSPLVLGQRTGGKPYLAAPPSGLEFNLSHSGGLALLAVSKGPAVGIDLERLRPVRDPLRIARRVLPGAVTQMLAGLSQEALAREFFHQWTRFEAMQKGLGRGVFDPPADHNGIQLAGFRPHEGYVACVAVITAAATRFRHFDHLES